MTKEYSREQLWKLFETLPQELKEAVFSEDTAETINQTCSRNGIEDERISEVARYTGRVLMGILLPKDFQSTIQKEARLDEKTAKNITDDINRLVFFTRKEAISNLHGIRTSKPERVSTAKIPEDEIIQSADSAEIGEEAEEETASEEKPTRGKGPDTYREPVE